MFALQLNKGHDDDVLVFGLCNSEYSRGYRGNVDVGISFMF